MRRIVWSLGVIGVLVAVALVALSGNSARRAPAGRAPAGFFPRLHSVAVGPIRTVLPGLASNGTCEVSGVCSLDPCVDAIDSPSIVVPNIVLTVPGRRSSAPTCHRRKATDAY